MDISGLLKGTGVQLERKAYEQFGAAVENGVGSKLSNIFATKNGSDMGPPEADYLNPPRAQAAALSIQQNRKIGVWDPTWYAAQLGDTGGNLNPKTKFLFKVRFKFHDPVSMLASSLNIPIDDLERGLSHVIKQIDLPKYDFEYEEVNMYNFRTKVLKSIKHNELSMVFYDTTGNQALSFASIYMQLLHPISRINSSMLSSYAMEDSGFAFTTAVADIDTSYRAVLPNNKKDILSHLIIEQYYIANTPNMLRVNQFIFTNPRIISFDLSDQDHEQGGTINSITARFDYDALHVGVNPYGTAAINTGTECEPAMPKGDIGNAREGKPSSFNASQAGKGNNPFVSIIASAGSRFIQQNVSGMLGGAFGKVAGGALGGSIYKVSSILGEQAQKTLSGIGSSVSTSISDSWKAARAKPVVVVDNNTPSGQVVVSQTNSTEQVPPSDTSG